MSVLERLREITDGNSEDQVNLLSEVAFNILYGVVPLDKAETRFFKLNKKRLRVLVGKSDWTVRRAALTPQLINRMVAVAIRYLHG